MALRLDHNSPFVLNPLQLPDCLDYCIMDEANSTYLPSCGCSMNIDVGTVGYQTYNVALIALLLPMLAVLGVLGNILNFIVYTKHSMRCSLNYYLAYLAISDLLVTISAVFMFTFEALRSSNATVRFMYLEGIPYVFPLAMIAQTCSVYYTVAAGVDCFICVVLPRSEKIYCTIKRAIIVGIVIFLLSLLYNVTRWFEVEIIECYDYHRNATHMDVCPSVLRQNELYNEIYYLNMYTIIMSVGPLLVLLVLNVLVVRATLRKKKRWLPATTRLIQQTTLILVTTPENNNEAADIVSLICVVCLFLFCNALSLAINFIETFTDVGNAMGYLIDLSNFLVVFNSSINFFIYLIFGANFRKTLLQLFSAKKERKRRKSRKRNNNHRLITD